MSVNYQRAREILEIAVKSALRRNPELEYEDLLAQASLVYVRTQLLHTPGRSLFEHHLRWRLRRELVDYVRRQAQQVGGLRQDKRTPILKRHVMTTEALDLFPTRQDLTERLDESDLLVVRLALSYNKYEKKRRVRSLIRQTLKDLGWSAMQIADSFQEIRKALHS